MKAVTLSFVLAVWVAVAPAEGSGHATQAPKTMDQLEKELKDAHAKNGDLEKKITENKAYGAWAQCLSFFGTLLLAVGLLFGTSHGSLKFRRATWRIIGNTWTILVAAMLFVAFKTTIHGVFGHHAEGSATHSTAHHARRLSAGKADDYPAFDGTMFGIFVTTFIVCLGATYAVTGATKDKLIESLTISGVAAHILCFFAVEIFELLQNLFAKMAVGGAVVSTLIAWLLGNLFVGGILGALLLLVMKVHPPDESEEENHKEGEEHEPQSLYGLWEELCGEIQDDVLCFAASYGFLRVIMFAISGNLPEITEAKHHHDGAQIAWLSGISMAGVLLSVAISSHYVHKKNSRPIEVGRLFLMDFAAWGWIHVGRWWFYETEFAYHKLTGRIIFALLASFVSFIVSMAVVTGPLYDSFHDADMGKGLKNMGKMAGLMIGFCWEVTFDMALEQAHEHRNLWQRWLATAVVAAALIPAYYMYVLPKTLGKKNCGKGGKYHRFYQQELEEWGIKDEMTRDTDTAHESDSEEEEDEEEGDARDLA